jgi:hypothetical protein
MHIAPNELSEALHRAIISHEGALDQLVGTVIVRHDSNGYRPLQHVDTDLLLRLSAALPSSSHYRAAIAIELVLRGSTKSKNHADFTDFTNEVFLVLRDLVTLDGEEMRSWPKPHYLGDVIAEEVAALDDHAEQISVLDFCRHLLEVEHLNFDEEQSRLVVAELFAVLAMDARSNEHCSNYACSHAQELRKPREKSSLADEDIPARIYAFLQMPVA